MWFTKNGSTSNTAKTFIAITNGNKIAFQLRFNGKNFFGIGYA